MVCVRKDIFVCMWVNTSDCNTKRLPPVGRYEPLLPLNTLALYEVPFCMKRVEAGSVSCQKNVDLNSRLAGKNAFCINSVEVQYSLYLVRALAQVADLVWSTTFKLDIKCFKLNNSAFYSSDIRSPNSNMPRLPSLASCCSFFKLAIVSPAALSQAFNLLGT